MNQLKVNQQQSIVSLIEQGWSKRRIARELGLDRATVRKYAGASKPAPQLEHRLGFKITHPDHRTQLPGQRLAATAHGRQESTGTQRDIDRRTGELRLEDAGPATFNLLPKPT